MTCAGEQSYCSGLTLRTYFELVIRTRHCGRAMTTPDVVMTSFGIDVVTSRDYWVMSRGCWARM